MRKRSYNISMSILVLIIMTATGCSGQEYLDSVSPVSPVSPQTVYSVETELALDESEQLVLSEEESVMDHQENVEKTYLWPQNYSFILYNRYTLGGLDRDGRLVPVSKADLSDYQESTGEWGFRLYKDGNYLGVVPYYGYSSEKLETMAEEYVDHSNYELMVMEMEYEGEFFDGLASNDNELLSFGSKDDLDISSEIYVNYIAEILAEQGLEGEPVIIREIVKMDLEKDGIDEVLIVASNIESAEKLKGQYSIVVVRKLIDGNVESLFLVKDFKNYLPGELNDRLLYDFKLLEIVDLDHDGVFELLIEDSYYEGIYYLVYKLVDGQFILTLSGGYGV